jgi:large subunit ribosomal protein L3
MKALITKKIGMTSIIDTDGSVKAVTLLSARPCVVTQVKTADTDGYVAVQVGTGDTSRLAKPQRSHNEKAAIQPEKTVEFRIDEASEDLKVGAIFEPDVFSEGDTVNVTGTSKGKGFAGTIKRHNFHRQRKTHGGKGNTRKVGSIGSMYPQKIFKGKKMSGQMGYERVTVRNLKVAFIDKDNAVIGLHGAVPGPKKGWIMIREAQS